MAPEMQVHTSSTKHSGPTSLSDAATANVPRTEESDRLPPIPPIIGSDALPRIPRRLTPSANAFGKAQRLISQGQHERASLMMQSTSNPDKTEEHTLNRQNYSDPFQDEGRSPRSTTASGSSVISHSASSLEYVGRSRINPPSLRNSTPASASCDSPSPTFIAHVPSPSSHKSHFQDRIQQSRAALDGDVHLRNASNALNSAHDTSDTRCNATVPPLPSKWQLLSGNKEVSVLEPTSIGDPHVPLSTQESPQSTGKKGHKGAGILRKVIHRQSRTWQLDLQSKASGQPLLEHDPEKSPWRAPEGSSTNSLAEKATRIMSDYTAPSQRLACDISHVERLDTSNACDALLTICLPNADTMSRLGRSNAGSDQPFAFVRDAGINDQASHQNCPETVDQPGFHRSMHTRVSKQLVIEFADAAHRAEAFIRSQGKIEGDFLKSQQTKIAAAAREYSLPVPPATPGLYDLETDRRLQAERSQPQRTLYDELATSYCSDSSVPNSSKTRITGTASATARMHVEQESEQEHGGYITPQNKIKASEPMTNSLLATTREPRELHVKEHTVAHSQADKDHSRRSFLRNSDIDLCHEDGGDFAKDCACTQGHILESTGSEEMDDISGSRQRFATSRRNSSGCTSISVPIILDEGENQCHWTHLDNSARRATERLRALEAPKLNNIDGHGDPCNGQSSRTRSNEHPSEHNCAVCKQALSIMITHQTGAFDEWRDFLTSQIGTIASVINNLAAEVTSIRQDMARLTKVTSVASLEQEIGLGFTVQSPAPQKSRANRDPQQPIDQFFTKRAPPHYVVAGGPSVPMLAGKTTMAMLTGNDGTVDEWGMRTYLQSMTQRSEGKK